MENKIYKKIIFIGISVAIFAGIFGSSLWAENSLDKIKFPSLKEPQMPDFETITLDNGMKIYFLEDHELPMVNAAVRMAAGGYLDPEDKVGLGSIVGTVLRTGGTQSRSGDEIDEELESIGASIEINVANTLGTANMNILSEYKDIGLELLADILRNPVFADDKIELAKTQTRSAISRRNDQAFQICVREFRKVIYGPNSVFARYPEYYTIDNITREDLIDFHQKYITPENLMMAIWGDFNTDEMKKSLISYFGDWPMGSGRVPKLPEVNYEYKFAVHYAEKKDINQSSVLIGHIGGFLGDPDYFPMIVMNNILGGSFGNRLFNNVRSKQGLAYAVGGSYTSNISYPGIYYNYCMTKSESTVKAIRGMIEQIKGMQTDPPTDAEMRLGKDGYLNSFVFNFEDKGDVITQIMSYDYFNFPRDFQFKAKSNVEKVTSEDVLNVAKRKLHPDALQIVVVGNGADFDEPLDVLGPVDTIDISIPTGEAISELEVSEEDAAKGRDLLKKAVAACGGIENFSKIKATSLSSTVTVVTPRGEIPIQEKSIFLLPDKERSDLTTPMGEMISVSNGADSWSKQGTRIVPYTAEEIDRNKKDQFRNTILTFQHSNDSDLNIAWVGSEELNGTPVEMIMIKSGDGQLSYKLALNSETFMPVGKKYFGQTIMGPANLTEIYSDYREVSGIMVPYAIIIESESGKAAEVKIYEFDINPEVEKGIFIKPEEIGD